MTEPTLTYHQVLESLEDQPRYLDELAIHLGTSPTVAKNLAQSAESLGLVKTFRAGPDCYSLTDEGWAKLAEMRRGGAA